MRIRRRVDVSTRSTAAALLAVFICFCCNSIAIAFTNHPQLCAQHDHCLLFASTDSEQDAATTAAEEDREAMKSRRQFFMQQFLASASATFSYTTSALADATVDNSASYFSLRNENNMPQRAGTQQKIQQQRRVVVKEKL